MLRKEASKCDSACDLISGVIRAFSQEQLALDADVDRSYLGPVERGDSVVAVLVVIRVANALGMTLEALTSEAKL